MFLHRWILQRRCSPPSRLTEHTPTDGQTCSCFLGLLCKHMHGTDGRETHGQGSGQTGGTQDHSTHWVPPRLRGPTPPHKRPLQPRRPTPQDKPGLTAPLTKYLRRHSGNPAPRSLGISKSPLVPIVLGCRSRSEQTGKKERFSEHDAHGSQQRPKGRRVLNQTSPQDWEEEKSRGSRKTGR